VFEEPQKPASDGSRALAEVIDSVTAVADSTADIAEKLAALVVRNESRDELFHREIRQAQSYLIEFRHKMESVNRDQQTSELSLSNVLSSTASILLKVEELNKDLTHYLYNAKDQQFERYLKVASNLEAQITALKTVHDEMQGRSAKLQLHQGDTVQRLDAISNTVKSSDALLAAMNRNLPQDIAEAFENTQEQRLLNLEAKVETVLQYVYKKTGKDAEGTDLDGTKLLGHWLMAQIKSAVGKVFAEILIFLLLWFYLLSGRIDSALSTAVRTPIQQVTGQIDPQGAAKADKKAKQAEPNDPRYHQ
jgi:hypothetical protein